MPNKTIRAIYFILCATLLTVFALASEEGAPLKSIAVLEFEAKGVSSLEASTLTDRFRSELVRTEKFVQIERSKIEQIFEEQKLQLSGTISEDKLVEIGELLGAELLVIGSIGKLGSTYTIDLRLVEVESGQIIASYFKDHRGEVDGLLGQFRIIAGEIAGKEVSLPTAPASNSPQVISSITGATPAITALSAQQKGKSDADADFSKFVWAGGGAASGTTGGCLLGLPGGLFATGAVAGAAYMVDAKPSQVRLAELNTTDAFVKQAYIRSYEEQIKKQRATWGGGGGTIGCCIGTLIAAMIITSTATTY